MREKTKKATFNLHPDVLAELDRVAIQGIVPSKNALVEQAIIKELKELNRLARKKRWQEGAKDPALLRDISDVADAFRYADQETEERTG
jgi:hypothetical protein